ncbi:unnamed protein product [Parnassius apollo]|uniref:(apollo) hypothetical protein n=1 Tax=Parnassius apollo TaxID=110799 RepID=A0A8S3XM63_PARAO|nr:unnamed protein product [Parnassius apollo]
MAASLPPAAPSPDGVGSCGSEPAARAYSDVYWVGVGQDDKYSVATLTPILGCQRVMEAERDPGVRDERINPSLSRATCSFVAGGARLQTAVGNSVGTAKADIRLLALKTRLMDLLRGYGCTFPTGVPWAVPLRADIPAEVALRDVLDNWQYTYTVITPRALDFYIRAGRQGEIDGACLVLT